MIVVNSSTRQFNIPGADLVFGVESDSGSVVKEFQCPRYVGNNLDLTGCFIRMNYRNANGEIDSYLVKNATVDGDNVVFGWELSPKVTMYKGNVSFVMCVVGPDTKMKWHTTLGRGQVLEGLEPDNAMIEEGTADVVAALIAMVEAQTETVADTGAEWVRNVQSEGTDQIIAVQTAARESREAAVAQIEAKGASTLATIPGEYTATVNAVQSAANAIRKKVSGEVIRVDDVSPMEHYPVVKVSGKNLIPYPYDEVEKTESDVTFTAQEDGGIVVNGTPTALVTLRLYNGNALLTKGKIHVSLQGDFTGVVPDFSLRDADGNTLFYEQYSTDFTVDLDKYPTAKTWRVYIKREINGKEMSGTVYPQIEVGESATEYSPYIDPTTVTVRRCGKNLIRYPFYEKAKTMNGVTFTDNGDGTLTVNGTATSSAYFLFYEGAMCLNGTYTLSGMSGGSGETYFLQPKINGVHGGGLVDGSRTYHFDGVLTQLLLNIVAGATISNLKISLMLEQGDKATVYERYNGTAHTPTGNGVVEGVPSLSPTMTLLTDTAGVNIECEYSRDTNAVIAEILEKITALGG